MGIMDKIERKYGQICRRCINNEYNADLHPSDCLYGYPFPIRCSCCGEQRNIVTGLRISGQLKILFRKK